MVGCSQRKPAVPVPLTFAFMNSVMYDGVPRAVACRCHVKLGTPRPNWVPQRKIRDPFINHSAHVHEARL